MINNKFFHSKLLVAVMLASFALLIIPKDGLARPVMGSMTGFVFGADMKTPLADAVVKLRNIRDGREYQSGRSDSTGLYSLKNLPEGGYILGVSSTKGDFNFDYALQIRASEIAKLSIALKPGKGSLKSQDPNKEDEDRKKGFFLTPLGIAVLIAAGGLLIYGGFELTGTEEISSSKR